MQDETATLAETGSNTDPAAEELDTPLFSLEAVERRRAEDLQECGRMELRARYFEDRGDAKRARRWRGQLYQLEGRLGVVTEVRPDHPLPTEADLTAWKHDESGVAAQRRYANAKGQANYERMLYEDGVKGYRSPAELDRDLERYARRIRSETLKWPATMTPVTGATVTRHAQPRGAGRPAAKRTASHSSGGGSSGDDSEPGEQPEPSQAGRLCQYRDCGRDISHKRRDAIYCDAHARGHARVDRQRALDKADPERVAERGAARQRANQRDQTSVSGPCPGPKGAVGQCGASPELISRDVDDGEWCLKCGTARGPLKSPNGLAASSVEMKQLDKLTVRRSVPREWRTRPKRPLSGRLRKTYREFVDESIVGGAP